MIVKKEVAKELVYCSVGAEYEGFKVIQNAITGHGRWSIYYILTLEMDGKFYQHGYSIGATESQDESAFEYDKDEIEFEEVFPTEKTLIVYESKGA